MSVSDEELQAFADGMLEGEDALRVEAAIGRDPDLERRVDRMRRAAATLRGAFDGVLRDPVPARLEAALAEADTARGEIVPFPQRLPRAVWAMAAAASLALAFVGGRLAAPDQPLHVADGRVLATGALEQALNSTPSGEPSGEAGPVAIALSFPRDGGGFCRVFRLTQGAGSAGLACGEHNSWTIVALANAPHADAGGYRQAAGDLPRSILEAAGEERAGDPLDSAAEAGLIRRGWRAAP